MFGNIFILSLFLHDNVAACKLRALQNSCPLSSGRHCCWWEVSRQSNGHAFRCILSFLHNCCCGLNVASVSELVSHFPMCTFSGLVLKFPSTTLYTYDQSPLEHVLNSVQFLLYKWTFSPSSLPGEGVPTVQYHLSLFLSMHLRNSLPFSSKFLHFGI